MIGAIESARRLGICIGIGATIALATSFLDAWFYHRGSRSAALLFNNCIIGVAVSLLMYLILVLKARKRERGVSLETIQREAALQERNRLAHEFHDNMAQS